jgi:hypothetical protein
VKRLSEVLKAFDGRRSNTVILAVYVSADLDGRLELEQDGLGHEYVSRSDACADQDRDDVATMACLRLKVKNQQNP